jgi:hypothetical protein
MTHKQILELAAASLNDTERAVYNDETLLPYYNIARLNLEEIFELNNIPVTGEKSDVINVPAGTTVIGFDTTPALPADLVEIQRVYESQEGQDTFVPIIRKTYLPPPSNGQISSFGIYSWQDQELKFPEAIVDIDIQIDYIKSLFSLLTLSNLNSQNIIKNSALFFQFRVAGLVVDIIEEDAVRASRLNGEAAASLQTSLGISVKGMQNIMTRRRPFRAGFKRRRGLYT